MQAIIMLLAAFILVQTVQAEARQVKVKSYRTRSGVWQKPAVRSTPDKNRGNNYSARGVINPVTGKAGTKNPLKR